MTSPQTPSSARRFLTALTAVAAAGLLAAGCSSTTTETAAPDTAPATSEATEPSFKNTYPAFQPLKDDSHAEVPAGPEPTVPGGSAPEGQAGAQQQGAQQQAAQRQAPQTTPPHLQGVEPGQYVMPPGSRKTIESARIGSINHIHEQLPEKQINGAKVDVFGTPATVCQTGDGYNITYILAGPNTSCDFARSTAGHLMGLTISSLEDLRGYVPPQISVTSPVPPSPTTSHAGPTTARSSAAPAVTTRKS
ncbi:hypothetical protein [Corynebacterium sp. HMSC072A04]|uniref:hypothetical protein n=1 Tax=Corynebacterium sp. HMSC072A04 TaxID=1715045 RepID=UPI000A4A755F|nr:hypothetical protein [Corynebacterium sp. HMSC072A04]